jgi:hypothetical protein
MSEIIAGIAIPDSRVAAEATDLIRATTNQLLFNHSRRVFLFGSLQARALGIAPDPELLYLSALFHDTGLVAGYRSDDRRFELDSANEARSFLRRHSFPEEAVATVWTAIALHTTPQVPYEMAPEIAATTAGVETDVLGLRLNNLTPGEIAEVTAAHPRPRFKQHILGAFNDGFKDRPNTTFGTVNSDVLEHFDHGFTHINFVDIILNSDWPE